ncbi:transglycosylase family protein [Arthrobacter koreensis]|jgi:nucleoid-associated protein YgaU|uniref:LysM peptidoglycan-binding domain-containing protein n=1 Tax=Arthrobacter koreensis TaxID=199136 RepID=UPI001264FED3|nr:transglycosylase family protein [Arthrobacter koreensis]MDF2496719.1 transglycosylase [Arthrobacter koreensis]
MKNSKITRYVRRGLAAAAITGAGAAGLAGMAAPANAASMDWDALAQCESGGNWGISTGNGFSGGLQFTPSTWAAFGGTGDPSNASREQQIAVAERVLAEQGPGAWPACTAKLGMTGATANPQAAAPVQQAPVAEAPVQTYSVPVEAPAAPVETYTAPVQPEAVAPVEVPATSQGVAAAVPAPAVSGESYTVQAGDTLSTIAEKLGIEGGWQALYAANTGTVIHPDLILTGQALQLPA